MSPTSVSPYLLPGPALGPWSTLCTGYALSPPDADHLVHKVATRSGEGGPEPL